MARKRHSDDYILKLLGEIEVKLSNGSDVQLACRGVGISDATYYNWLSNTVATASRTAAYRRLEGKPQEG